MHLAALDGEGGAQPRSPKDGHAPQGTGEGLERGGCTPQAASYNLIPSSPLPLTLQFRFDILFYWKIRRRFWSKIKVKRGSVDDRVVKVGQKWRRRTLSPLENSMRLLLPYKRGAPRPRGGGEDLFRVGENGRLASTGRRSKARVRWGVTINL